MKEIALATTTSAKDSGLLDQLLPKFEASTGYKVKVQAVGSGIAMDMARKGKADVLLVHNPDEELKLIAEGIGTNRRLVMHNDFILVGPSTDTAKVKGIDSIIEAFKIITRSESTFISRGDSSGTDHREKVIWQKANINPYTANYQETKSGMAETLAIASGKNGYVLTDRATFLSNKKNLELEIMVESDDLLLNMYHAIQVKPQKFPNINDEGAQSFINFLVSSTAQDIIGSFMKDKYGHSLFIPDADKTEGDVIKGKWKQMQA